MVYYDSLSSTRQQGLVLLMYSWLPLHKLTSCGILLELLLIKCDHKLGIFPFHEKLVRDAWLCTLDCCVQKTALHVGEKKLIPMLISPIYTQLPSFMQSLHTKSGML